MAARLVVLALTVLICAAVVDRIVAVVGSEVITQRELDRAYLTDDLALMRPNPLTGASAEPLTEEQYLDELIKRKVIEQEVKKQGIRVDALDVEKAIDRKRESLGLSETEFEKALAMQGIAMAQYREQVKDQLIAFRLISQEVQGEIEISPKEVQAFYNQHPELFMSEDRLHLLHIFVPFSPGAGPAAETQAISQLNQIRDQIVAGADFADLARQYSKSPTAMSGGDLGWFTIKELLPEFRSQVRRLEPGQMSPVFVQGEGAHLVLLKEVEKGSQAPLEAAEEKIRDILYQQEAMQRYDLWLERLKANTYIEKRLDKAQDLP